MKFLVLAINIVIATTNLIGQDREAQMALFNEGTALYRSEMASWYGSDVFLAKFPVQSKNFRGYFSYAIGDSAKCLFYSNSTPPVVLATMTFDMTYSLKTVKIDSAVRGFTPFENELCAIRDAAVELVGTDTLFKYYKNTNFNLIPLISGDSKRVFVLTGPKNNGVLVFGNDYLITFNKDNQIVDKKQLHKNIIFQEYGPGGKKDTINVEGGIHTHLPETGEFITSTDICTLLLYGKYTGWKSYYVIGENYVSLWDCKTNTLAIVTKEVFEKIGADNEEPDR